MTIRTMTPQDYDASYALWTRTAGMGMRSIDDSREGIARFLLRNPTTCFIAEEHTTLIGTILCGHDGRRGYIYHATVDDAYRRHGIGKALVEAATDALIAEGIQKVAFVVFKTNEKGNAFWQSLGYDERPDLVYRNKSLNPDNQ